MDNSLPSPGPTTAETRARFHLLFVCLLVVGAGNSMLQAVLPPLVRQLHLPDSSIGWIFSLSALLWVLTSPYWGRVSNRTGRKPIIALGLAAYCVSMGSFATAVTLGLSGIIGGAVLFVSLVLARSIFGTFGSASSPAAQAYIADNTTMLERTEQLAALTAAFAVGQAFGPGMCAALAARFGMVFPLALVSASAAVAAFAVWRFLPEQKRPEIVDASRAGPWDALHLAADPRIAGYLIYGLGASIVTGTLSQVFGLYVMDRLHVEGSKGTEIVALGFMVNALTLIATQMAILPRLKLAPRSLMAWGATIIAAGVCVQILSVSMGGLLVAQVIQGLGFGLARPGFTGGASMSVRPDEQGATAGLVVASNGAGFVVSPMTGAVAYQMLGMDAPLWIALTMLFTMLIFAIRSRRLRISVQDTATALNEP